MYKLNAVHIETATTARKKRDSFATRLNSVIKMSNLTNSQFAKMVQQTIDDKGLTGLVKFTAADIRNVMVRGTQLKANKVAALTLATGLDRAFFEDFSRTPKQILAATRKK